MYVIQDSRSHKVFIQIIFHVLPERNKNTFFSRLAKDKVLYTLCSSLVFCIVESVYNLIVSDHLQLFTHKLFQPFPELVIFKGGKAMFDNFCDRFAWLILVESVWQNSPKTSCIPANIITPSPIFPIIRKESHLC